MYQGHLKSHQRQWYFLKRCLENPSVALGLDESSFHDRLTYERDLPHFEGASSEETRFVISSRFRKVAWFRVYLRFLASHGITTEGFIPQMGNTSFEKFIQTIAPRSAFQTKQDILEQVLGGSRYEFLCASRNANGDHHVHEGYLFIIPNSIEAYQWEKGIREDGLLELRTHLQRSDVRNVVESMQHQSCSLLDSSRKIINHYIAAIESSSELNSLLEVVDRFAEQRAEVDNGDDASTQRAIQSRRSSSEILWQASENDAHAAEAQLQWELEQATSYQEQAAGDINELFRFMTSEDTEDDSIPEEEEIPGDLLQNNIPQYASISHTKEAAPNLQPAE
ncbi:MAG: hypothetical protein Q9207_006943, partial [Kuettlingeria erythrocarpa]